ncbi:MAG: hypothetical protein R3Y23_00225 [Bacillota bacterium]
MKKSKLLFNKLLTILLVTLLAFSMFSLVACNPPDDEETTEEETETSDLLITNGTFYTASNSSSSDAYLNDTVSGWSKTSGSTTYSSATLGVIDLYDDKDSFYDSWSAIDDDEITYPGIAPNTPVDEDGAYTDTNALLVGIPDSSGSVYYKTSSSISLEENSYYELSIDVYTDIEEENDLQGAWIFVNGDAYTEFSSIQTNGSWKTYTIYIESNNYESRSIYVELWLGNGPQYLGSSTDANLNPRSTTGYAMFDNIILTQLDDSTDYDTVLNNDTFQGVEGVIGDTSVQSLIYADSNFTYSSKITSISPSSSTSKVYYSAKLGSANNYTMVVGKEDAETSSSFASYSTSYSTAGIFDMSSFYTITEDDDGNLVYTDAYEEIDTSSTSDFSAPSYKDFYTTDGIYSLYGTGDNGRTDISHDTTALLIYHPTDTTGGLGYTSNDSLLIEANKYYEISVWVYVWYNADYGVEAPDAADYYTSVTGYDSIGTTQTFDSYREYFKEEYWSGLGFGTTNGYAASIPTLDEYLASDDAGDNTLTEGDYDVAIAGFESMYEDIEEYLDDVQDFRDAYSEWEADEEIYNTAVEGLYSGELGAEFKITGASVDNESFTQVQTTTSGEWVQLTQYVKGNELSDRYVDLEFWYGEGEWESNTLTVGGALFDNLTITVYESADDVPDPDVYQELSSYTEEELAAFNLTDKLYAADGVTELDYVDFGPDDDNVYDNGDSYSFTDDWTFEFVDSRTSNDIASAGMISGDTAISETDWIALCEELGFGSLAYPGTMSVNYDGANTNLNVVMMYNNDYTATTLTYLPMSDDGETEEYIEILPNTFYRLSMWVKTEAIAEDFALSIAVYDSEGSSITSISSITTYGEWSEVSFYLAGSTTDVTYAYIVFSMGSGDIYTPASHATGVTYITAMLNDVITYSEYSSAASGSYISSASISDASLSTDTVTNGLFANFDSSNYDDDSDIFDASGNLIGVATPSSWTETTSTSALSKPLNGAIEEEDGVYYLTWDAVDFADYYFIVMDSVKDSENTLQSNHYVGYVVDDGEDTITWAITADAMRSGSFKIMAYSETYGISAFSTAVSNTEISDTVGTLDYVDFYGEDFADAQDLLDEAFLTESGIINYKYYGDADDNGDYIYSDMYSSSLEGITYKSVQSDNLLMLSSNYYTKMGYTMTSAQTLSASSYYVLCVWVKTTDDATASVTIQNTSNVFASTVYDDDNATVDGDYVGYTNIDTKGEWVQYRFYVQTTINSASIKLELWLGNQYAVDCTETDDDGNAISVSGGLTKGSVFFDDISIITLDDEDAFNTLVYGSTDPDDVVEGYAENTAESLTSLNNNYFINQYIYKKLDYTTDSFDIFTEADEDELLGGEPGDYTHYVPTSGVDYEDSEDASMLYGVYDERTDKISQDTISAIYDAFSETDWFASTEDEINSFMTTGGKGISMGNNFLFMANLVDNGQYYESSTFTVASESYYKVTFYAKTWLATDEAAEFRFYYGNDTENWSTIEITDSGVDVGDGMYEYTMYIYNPTSSSISSNSFAFFLGDNDDYETVDGAASNFFMGMMVVDNVSVIKLDSEEEYIFALENGTAGTACYEFTEDETEDEDTEEEEEDTSSTFDSSLWLILSSVVIGAILLAVIIILTYRKVAKKIKKKIPVKYESNVPVNQKTAEERRLEDRAKVAEPIEDDDLKD